MKVMSIIRMTIAILLLAGVATASAGYESIDTTNFANRGAAYQGLLVAVTGEVCSVNADGKSIRVFDAQSKALIDVNLSKLKKTQRSALMLNPVRRVSVYGQAQVLNGRLIIEAHQVVPRTEVAPTRQVS
jgi:type 1 fimbria pilin